MTEETSEFIATLYVFAERLREEYDQAATEAGLTPQQAVVLGLLADPLPMRDLAERRHCDPSNITGIVDRLQDKGLVERSPDPTDRRVKRVTLTEAGRTRLARFHDELRRVSCLAGLTPDQRRRLLAAVPEVDTDHHHSGRADDPSRRGDPCSSPPPWPASSSP